MFHKPMPENVLLSYHQKTKKAEIFLFSENEAKKSCVFKYYITNEHTVAKETLNSSSLQPVKQNLLHKKDIDEVPYFQEYIIPSVDIKILKDLLDNKIGKSISGHLDHSSKKGTPQELTWAITSLNDVDLNISKDAFITTTSTCRIM